MPSFNPTVAALLCIAAFLCGCSTPPATSAKLPAGFWTKCAESEATHIVTVDYAIDQSLRSRASWYIKRIASPVTSTAPLEATSQTIEMIRSGETVRDKCESVFYLVAPSTRFPAAPFLLSMSMKWQTRGKSDELSRVLEVRNSFTPDVPEKNLKMNVSISELTSR